MIDMQFRFEFGPVLGLLLWTGSAALAADNSNSTPSGTAASWANLFEDPVVARAKGVEVKRSQVDNAFIAFKANLALRGQTLPEDMRRFREAMLLDRLIINQLMVNRVIETDKARAKEITAKFMAELKKEFPSEEAFTRRVKALGMTTEQYYKIVEDQGLADAVLDRELKSKITITDAAVRQFYDTGTDVLVQVMEAALDKMAKNPDTRLDDLSEAKKRIDEVRKANLTRLGSPETVRVIHLLLATIDRDKNLPYSDEQQRAKRQLIDKLLVRARTGEDFSKMVLDFSEDRGLKETKGEYTLSQNSPFTPEFKAAAFSLKTNQISDVVVTPYGYHIIKLLEKTPARKSEFEKVAPDIKEHLSNQELQKQMPDFFAKIKQEAAVEILDPRYQIKPATEEGKQKAAP